MAVLKLADEYAMAFQPNNKFEPTAVLFPHLLGAIREPNLEKNTIVLNSENIKVEIFQRSNCSFPIVYTIDYVVSYYKYQINKNVEKKIKKTKALLKNLKL